MIINHKGTRMVKDGEDWHGLQTTKLKSLAKLFKPFNRYWAPLKLKSTGIVKKQCKTQRYSVYKESTRGDLTLLTTFTFTKLSVCRWDRVIFVQETEAIIRKVPLVRSPKQVHRSHFHIPLIFFSTLPAMQYQRYFSLFDTFPHLRN